MRLISIVIISFNRPKETIESIHNVMFELEEVEGVAKELIVINNGSTVDYSSVDAYIRDHNLEINYIDNPDNLGVSGGRNIGITEAKGDCVVFIDDDAVFKKKDGLKVLHKKFQEYESQGVAIIGFGIENYFSGEPDHPVKDQQRLAEQDEFLNNIFWGCGFAVKKEVFDSIGKFDDGFFYGMEEYDFTYRAMEQGFKILFTKNIIVLHKVSQKGREINVVKNSRMFVNKCLIAYRYLPWKYVASHIVMWSGYFLQQTKGNVPKLLAAMSSLFKKMKSNKRSPVSGKTLDYIHSVSGRITY